MPVYKVTRWYKAEVCATCTVQALSEDEAIDQADDLLNLEDFKTIQLVDCLETDIEEVK